MAHTQENKSGVLLTTAFKDDVIGRFYKVRNLSEFVSLLNYIDINLNNPKEEIYPLTVKHLYHLSKTKDSRYKTFNIPKKNGDLREINSPDNLLKRVQTLINFLLQVVFFSHSHYNSNGFLLGKDIVRNALPHINKKFILNIDLKNFFHSISFRRIKVVLELSPFNLKDNREVIGFLISNLGTYKGSLTQGAPTSPIFSNIVSQKLDRKLSKFCISRKVKYSRYADDLTFSANKEVLNDEFIQCITKIVEDENFKINNDKTRLRTNTECQEVTGLVVNNKVNVKREYLQKVRAMLNNWEKGGLKFAEKKFNEYRLDGKDGFNFKNVLLGHLSFLMLVKGKENKIIKDLRKKYLFLNNLIDYSFINNESVMNRLIKDNSKMEVILFENKEEADTFISFCTIAFHQIENLINYYYWKKFPNFDDLLNELVVNNKSFKKSYKTVDDAKQRFKKISELNINVLVYLYEKEFFFDIKKYYNKHLTMLREIRNDDSHRCSVIGIDVDSLKKKFFSIEDERVKKRKMNKNFLPSKEQEKIELNYQTLIFLEKKEYREVRKNLNELVFNIKNNLTDIGI